MSWLLCIGLKIREKICESKKERKEREREKERKRELNVYDQYDG